MILADDDGSPCHTHRISPWFAHTRYSLSEFATARRTAVVRAFIDALTHGGPGGTPKPIELHAHDALRYISDMLAWLHQCLASERELLCQLLSVNLTGDDSSATTPLSTAGARNAPHHPLVFSEEDA